MAWKIGNKHSKKSIENMRESHKLSWKKNPNQGMTGKKRSVEFIKKWHNSKSINQRWKKGEHASLKTEWEKGKKSDNWNGFKKGNIPWWIKKNVPHPWFNNGSSKELYGKDWSEELKEIIRKKYNYRCQQCFRHQNELYNKKSKKYKLSVHHIDYNKKNNNENNLIPLCKSCHAQTNFSREDWKKYFLEKEGGIYA